MKSSFKLFLILTMLAMHNISLIAQGTWTHIGNMPEVRLGHTVDEINGKIYVAGGVKNEQSPPTYPTDTTMFICDSINGSWIQVSLPNSIYRSLHTSCVVDGNLYLIGGLIPIGGIMNSTAEMWMYNTATGEWISKPSMPTHRCNIDCAVVDGKIYVMGGMQVNNGIPNNTELLTLEVYNIAAGTWSPGPNMTSGRWGHQAIAYNGKIYVVGGNLPVYYSSVEVFDTQTNSWTILSTLMPTGRYQFTACLLDTLIYTIDGWFNSANGPIYDKVEVYNPIANVWTTETSMPVAVGIPDCFAMNGKIYVFGGSNTTHPLHGTSDIYEFTPQLIPVAPSNLIAEAYDFSVNLSWQDNSVNELGFIIQRKNGDTSSVDPYITIDTVAADVITYLDTGLIPNTMYTYRICAYNLAGNSAFTSQLQIFTTPIEFISFTATSHGDEIILNWSTATETNNSGFNIERKSANADFSEIGFVPGFGTTTEPKSYQYTDSKVSIGKYTYRLKQIDFDGSFEYLPDVEVEVSAPIAFSLEQSYPNPFNPSTTIGFGIQNKSNVKITILNAIGEEVAVLLNEEREAGFHQVEFNASSLPSGVYFYQLIAGNFVETKKMVLMK